MKLSQYAEREGILYRSAWNRFKAGKIPGAYLKDDGHIFIPDPESVRLPQAVVYARVSSHKQRDDLDRQADRMVTYANAQGLSVIRVVKEVASGVNDSRSKLTSVLQDDSWGTLVVEHRDRLTRVGFNLLETLLTFEGRRISVANRAQERGDDLMEDFMSIVYSFSARLYGQRSARSKAAAVKAALK